MGRRPAAAYRQRSPPRIAPSTHSVARPPSLLARLLASVGCVHCRPLRGSPLLACLARGAASQPALELCVSSTFGCRRAPQWRRRCPTRRLSKTSIADHVSREHPGRRENCPASEQASLGLDATAYSGGRTKSVHEDRDGGAERRGDGVAFFFVWQPAARRRLSVGGGGVGLRSRNSFSPSTATIQRALACLHQLHNVAAFLKQVRRRWLQGHAHQHVHRE